MSFNEKLQKLRKENKYSQEELADLLDVTRQSVSKWESGQTYPEMDKLISLCKIFNCTLDELTNDNIKEINLDKKTGFNNIMDSILDYVSRTYKMITNMSFKELFICGGSVFIIILFLFLVKVPLNIFKESLYNLFISLGGDNLTSERVSIIFNFFLDTTYFLISILLFVYIFKIGFLDKYEFITKTKDYKKKPEEVKEIITEIKEERIIKEPKEHNYEFFKSIGFLVMLFVKFGLVCFIFPFIFLLIGLVAALVIDIYLLFKGVLYFSIPIIVIFSIIINILIIYFVFNIIFNRKNNYRKMLIVFLISLCGLGIGAGALVLDAHNTKYFNSLPADYKKIIETKEIDFKNDMYFENYYNLEYIIKEDLKNKIVVEMEYYKDFNSFILSHYDNEYHIDNVYLEGTSLKVIDFILKALSERKMYNINLLFDFKVRVYGNAQNINKIKVNETDYYKKISENESNYDNYQRQISDLNDQINDLNSRIFDLEEKNSVLSEEKNNLKNQIAEYKEKIKSLIE